MSDSDHPKPEDNLPEVKVRTYNLHRTLEQWKAAGYSAESWSVGDTPAQWVVELRKACPPQRDIL